MMDAIEILQTGISCIGDRASQRDLPDGERSMGRAVKAFNAIYGHQLTECDGWQFMSILKKARASAGEHRLDDYTDDAAYCALAGESAEREAEAKRIRASARPRMAPDLDLSVDES